MRHKIATILLLSTLFLAGCAPMVQPTKMTNQLSQARVQADIAIAQTLMQQQRYPQAKAQLLRALAVAPYSVAANLALADYYQQTKQVQQAGQVYQKLLQRQPDDSLVQWQYGNFLCYQGDTVAGLELLQRVAQMQRVTQPAQLSIDIAQCAAQGKDYALSSQAYQQAIDLAPNNATIYVPYARVLLQQRHFTKAQYLLQTYWRIHPEDEASLKLAVLIAETQDDKKNQAFYQLRLNSYLYAKQLGNSPH